jgi:hypothetical protein
MPYPSQNSQEGTSGEWFMVCHKEESTHVKADSLPEVAGVAPKHGNWTVDD